MATYTTQFYESYVSNNKHTNTTRTAKTTTSTLVSPLEQIRSYNWDNSSSGVFIFKLCNKSANFVHFVHHQFVQSIDPEKPFSGLMNNFVHFIIVIRNGKIVWNHGPYYCYFHLNLKYLGWPDRACMKTQKMLTFGKNWLVKMTLRLFFSVAMNMVPRLLRQFRRCYRLK